MSNQTLESLNFLPEEDPEDDQLDKELAVIGLAAMVEAHNDGIRPFGTNTFIEPVSQGAPAESAGSIKWCNRRQNDGTWASLVDDRD